VDEAGIHVVHCTMRWSLAVAWTALRMARRRPPLVLTIHSTVQADRKAELRHRLLYSWMLRRCARVLFVCDEQRRHWCRRHRFLERRGAVVHNGIDCDAFSPEVHRDAGRALRRALEIPDRVPVVGCVAGFRAEKGHHILVEAVARARREFVLLLAGEGELRHEVESQVRRAGLEDRVRFLGEVADVRPVLAASALTVLASTAVESFSLAMLESLAMAVPVLASDVGGLREAVRSGETGLLVSRGDSRGLAQGLDQLLGDTERLRLMGRNGRALVESKFTVEEMVRRTTRELSTVGATGSGGGGRR
jgi:glycosyltransferase involved in cell wall biosynthesis